MPSMIDALIAHWPLNDNADSATVVDATGNYDGTYKDGDGNVNTSTGASTGVVNGALDFDGDEYIDTGDTFQSTFQDSFSISLWCKPTDGQPAATGWLFGVSTVDPAENDCVWMVLANTGALTFQYSSNGNRGRLFLNAGLPLFSNGQETWHHLVMVVDSTIRAVGGVKGYLDGVLQPVGALSKGDTTDVVSADFTSIINPFIGAEDLGGPTNEYNGLIDNVMLFNKALTQKEIRRLYRAGMGEEQILTMQNRCLRGRYNKWDRSRYR